ncbi:MAG: hypothetical protein IT164_06115 [Bryobacterales bacterium]|nr:hypothetical protein [Bryobacterales bacterium]
MADKVHITKRGIQALKWDSEIRQYVEQEIRSGLHVLRCACHIDAGVTLGDIFHAVEQDRGLAAFLEQWSWCDLDAFHAEARKPADAASDLSYIEIAKYFKWDEHEAQETFVVSGAGHPDEHGMTRYAIDFTPVNQLVHLPVRLRPEMEIRKDRKKVGEAPCTFTLLDVLGEIYFEISFYGSPEDRDRQSAQFQESLREVEEGRATLTPWNPREVS